MKGWWVREFGGPEVMSWDDLPEFEPPCQREEVEDFDLLVAERPEELIGYR